MNVTRRGFLGSAGALALGTLVPEVATAIPVRVRDVRLQSPDRRLHFFLRRDPAGRLSYWIGRQGQTVVRSSGLGFELSDTDGGAFAEGLELHRLHRSTEDVVWTNPFGERRTVEDRYSAVEMLVTSSSTDTQALLEVRVYDAGVAFRWIVLKANGQMRRATVVRESTSFCLPRDTFAWATYSAQGRYNRVPVSEVTRGVERPLTLELERDDLVASITEAANLEFARMKLSPDPDRPGTLVSDLDGTVEGGLPLVFPWRVVLVGQRPGDLLEGNDLLLNLNEPAAVSDTSWIRPGTVIRCPQFFTDTVKQYVDFAAAHNVAHVLLDTGWYGAEFKEESDPTVVAHGRFEKYPREFYEPGGPLEGQPIQYIEVDLDLPQVIAHATERGVGIILYINRVALENYNLQDVFSTYRSWGVAGIKMGFVQVGPQEWTRFVNEAVALAGRNRLMVNVHDEYRPTGLRRTFPHWLTMEGVGGDETNPTADHDLALLFTRYVAGPADHTWNYYHESRLRGKKSPAFQLAAGVVFFSPWQHIFWGEGVLSAYDAKPAPDYWFGMPTVWDDTRVLEGKIGQYATIARRSGRSWWIGAVTALAGHTSEIVLDFLEPDVNYTATRYVDDPSDPDGSWPTPVSVTQDQVTQQTTLRIALSAKSGEAIRIDPQG